jgi:hypothetical protein
MAVAFDAVSESHSGTTGATGAASFTWNHGGGASARGALVFVFGVVTNALPPVTSVTYGGATMTAVPYTAIDTDTEPGSVRAYYLDNCGTGTKAVVVNRSDSTPWAHVLYAVCYTVTAAKATEVYLPGVQTQAGSAAPATAASSSSTGAATNAGLLSITDGSPGTNSLRFMGRYQGTSNVTAAGTGSTAPASGAASIDFGVYIVETFYETTAGQGARNVGGANISDDLAVIALAVREVPPENHNGAVTGTGGGIIATASTSAHNKAAASTGGGVLASASTSAHNKAFAATGGGVATGTLSRGGTGAITATGGGVAATAGAKGGRLSLSATGGGVLTWAAEAVSVENHDGSFAATGGGTFAIASTAVHKASLAATGGGDIASTGATGRSSGTTATGGGVASVGASGGRRRGFSPTGGGTASTADTSNRASGLVATGAGRLGANASGAHRAALTASGGGTAHVLGTQAQAEDGSFTATGGGVLSWSAVAALAPAEPDHPRAGAAPDYRPIFITMRRGSLRATGGGGLTIEGRASWNDDDLALQLAGVA